MVKCQLQPSKITNSTLLCAMMTIPREDFVGEDVKPLAYFDDDVVRGPENYRALLQPIVLARLVQALDIQPHEKVLVVGCGDGYTTAVVSYLAQSVWAIDDNKEALATVKRLLAANEADSVTVEYGSLVAGNSSHAPYDKILINGSIDTVPAALLEQVSCGGAIGYIKNCSRDKQQICILEKHRKTHTEKPIWEAFAHNLNGFDGN
ncbi:MAG: protein-L-isoaspartate O-methyltransferase family protein [Alphaproteobacteria bacterium]